MDFAIRALGPHGVETLRLAADSSEAARRELAGRQLQVLSIEPAHGNALSLAKANDFDLLLFSQELLALLEAGLTLSEALDALHEKERRPATAAILGTLRGRLAEGQRFAAALAEQPAVFPALYCGLMRAAEGTASLDTSLARYIEYRQRVDQVRRHVGQAMIYPAILLGVGLLVSLFLLGYVVPKFSSVYQSSGRDIPLASQLLMGWGRFVSAQAKPLLIATLLLLGSVIGLMANPSRRARLGQYLHNQIARLPGLGERLRTFELARLYLALGTLLASGLPILEALNLCSGVVGEHTREQLQRTQTLIGEGHPASTAFEATELTTPVALRLMRVGERTGRLCDMLTRAARFHDGEIERFIARFTRSFEPLLMAAIGLLVGTIVVLLYMPIFDLAGSFQ